MTVDPDAWRQVDEGWGRRAPDFASLSEPANAREYVAMHHRLGVDAGDRLLDLACGSGLALELAALRGARVAGIDASERLVAVARHRVRDGDVRVGDMHALPWEDDSFDVVTSFRGIWGTTPDALHEARRVLRPGGRLGLTVWGHIKASSGAWALSPFRLATEDKVRHQADMVALGRPGAGEQLLERYGFVDVERVTVPFAWEFADPATYARTLASTGPAYEAIQAVGEEEFLRRAEQAAAEHVRDGLPLRAEIDVVGYLARVPEPAPTPLADARPGSFLAAPPATRAATGMYAEDLEELGYVMNASRLWGHQVEEQVALFELIGKTAHDAGLSFRDRGILVLSMARSLGDSYCSLAWGRKVAATADPAFVTGVLRADDSVLDERERVLATWARAVTLDPNAVREEDLTPLRAVGYDDAQVLAITLFVALRQAFSTVNDALGARPDAELVASVPPEVAAAVTWGRSPD
jgi:SAM-dependent methyltransferase/alkylhydroperoxidase family enzyme